jgi:hypothetical protein
LKVKKRKVKGRLERLHLTFLHQERLAIVQEMRTTRATEKLRKMRSDVYALGQIIEREEALRKLGVAY